MNLPFDIRKGNIVEYSGPIGHYNYVRVLEVETFEDNRQIFTLENPYEKEKTFVGYSEHVRPIFLRESHLNILGFDFNPELRRYNIGGLSTGSFGYPEGDDPMNLTYVDLGFRILPVGFPRIPTIDQVKTETTEVFYLHSLQNYCSDKPINNLNFDLIN